jgi:hypothetical protein
MVSSVKAETIDASSDNRASPNMELCGLLSKAAARVSHSKSPLRKTMRDSGVNQFSSRLIIHPTRDQLLCDTLPLSQSQGEH